MLANLAVCASMFRSEALLDVLDHWSLLMQGASRHYEGFRPAKLCNDI